MQPFHALPKSRLSLAVVLNVIAGKEVSLLQPFHVFVKFVPLDRFRAGKEVNAALLWPLHASEKLMSSSGSRLKVQAPKECVEYAYDQVRKKLVPSGNARAGKSTMVVFTQASLKVVPLDTSRTGKVVNKVLYHAPLKLVQFDKSMFDGKDVMPPLDPQAICHAF